MSKKNREGRKIKGLTPMAKVSPYIMVERADAQNHIRETINIEAAEYYIYKKRSEGKRGFGMLHLIIAAYVRMLSQRPAVNRFIRGQKPHARNGIEILMSIKKEMTIESPDTCIKMRFRPDMTSDEVYEEIQRVIEDSRADTTGFDSLAKVLNFIPGLFLKSTFWFLKTLDYFGMLPRKLTKLSPFHGSMFITSMGSLGIPAIYHHLYNFGNVPVFISFGAKYYKNELMLDGSVERNKYIDMTCVMDERIVDGYYFASALKYLKETINNPDKLDLPPEAVVDDIK